MATRDLVDTGRVLVLNKATPIGTISGGEQPAAKFLQAASVVADKTFPAGVPGHYFVFGHKPLITTGEPLRANFHEAGDAVIFAFKLVGTTTQLYGITVAALIAWKAPSRGNEVVSEDGVLQTWKATHSDIKELIALENTETHKLKDLADKLMSHLPTFAVHKVRSARDAVKWCSNGYAANVKELIDKSEVEERAKQKEGRPQSARDREWHQEVGKIYKERKENLLQCVHRDQTR